MPSNSQSWVFPHKMHVEILIFISFPIGYMTSTIICLFSTKKKKKYYYIPMKYQQDVLA